MEDVTKREGRTVLFVSHNMGAIQNFCSRTLLLDKGKIIEIGKTEKIIGGYLELNTQLGKISLKDRQDRKGDGRIIFKDVVFKDYHNKDVPYFRSGEDALIYIYYECLDPNIKDFYIGFSIDTFFNQNRVAFIGNKILKQKIIVQEDGVIKLRINKLPLNIGRYQFTLIAVDSGVEIYDWVQKAGEFDVEFGDYYNNGILPPAHDGFLLLDYSFDN
jgi:lipopolysaccharide transport system ATP-binding protein